MDYPAFHAEVFETQAGVSYLKEPCVAMLSAPNFDNINLEPFLEAFHEELQFGEYTLDCDIEDGTELCKTAGQLCYFSFGVSRTRNDDAQRYFDNILSSGHGSVLEHANYSFLLYGVSRSFTHELVRHRVGIGYSQVSQRYVSGKTLRFVERPEYQQNDMLHTFFERRIDLAASEYDMIASVLTESMADKLGDMAKTEKRKAVNQAARSVLPNETEAPIIITANVRTLRHLLEMRGSIHAEPEIRRFAVKLYRCMAIQAPVLFNDYKLTEMKDGSLCVETKYRKV